MCALVGAARLLRSADHGLSGFKPPFCDGCLSADYHGPTCTFCNRDQTCAGVPYLLAGCFIIVTTGRGNCSSSGICICEDGFTGPNCLQCERSSRAGLRCFACCMSTLDFLPLSLKLLRSGDPNRFGSNCLPCPGGVPPCNGNGTCNSGNSGNGFCDCSPGHNGPSCEFSGAKSYAAMCRFRIPSLIARHDSFPARSSADCADAVACSGHGTVSYSGACQCDDGYRSSPSCDSCQSGWSGVSFGSLACCLLVLCRSTQGCWWSASCLRVHDADPRRCGVLCVQYPNCQTCTPSQCNNQGSCNVQGQCDCDNEWLPPDCRVCGSNGYGQTCQFCSRAATCSSNAELSLNRLSLISCAGHGACTQQAGCLCDPGFLGANCSLCAPGFWSSNCSRQSLLLPLTDTVHAQHVLEAQFRVAATALARMVRVLVFAEFIWFWFLQADLALVSVCATLRTLVLAAPVSSSPSIFSLKLSVDPVITSVSPLNAPTEGGGLQITVTGFYLVPSEAGQAIVFMATSGKRLATCRLIHD